MIKKMQTKNIKQTESSQESMIEKEKMKSRAYSLRDAAYVSATIGFGDNYITAYGIALNASPTAIGLLNSLPNLIGSFLQIYTSKLMRRFSRKKIISIATLLQSLIWIPIILVSLLFVYNSKSAPVFLILFYTLYAAFGNIAAPAWASWIGDLVPPKAIGKFFGKRNSIASVSTLIAMILGGLILDVFKKVFVFKEAQGIFLGFAVILMLAMICRLISRYYLLLQYEAPFRFDENHYFSFWKFLKLAPQRNFGRFTIFVALMLFTTNIVGPFFAVYMLKDLNFSYLQFMLVNVFGAIATFLFMPSWGRFSDKYGNISAIKITSLIIPLIGFLWPLSVLIPLPYQFYFLLFVNFFAGFSWAGFNLAAGNFLYDATSAQKRSLCFAYSSVLNSVGVVAGTSLGAFLISHLKISFLNIIMFVSLLSGATRYVVAGAMVPKLKEPGIIEHKPTWKALPLFSQISSLPLYFQNIFPKKAIKIFPRIFQGLKKKRLKKQKISEKENFKN